MAIVLFCSGLAMLLISWLTADGMGVSWANTVVPQRSYSAYGIGLRDGNVEIGSWHEVASGLRTLQSDDGLVFDGRIASRMGRGELGYYDSGVVMGVVTVERRGIRLPAWLVALLLGLPALHQVHREIRWRIANAKTADGRCSNCGYDLRATPERCPECGISVTSKT